MSRLAPILLPLALLGCTADQIVLGHNIAHLPPNGATQALLQVDGRTVDCWTVRTLAATEPAGPDAYVLFFVGKLDRAENWAKAVADTWAPRGVEVWAINYTGSGQSDGPVDLARTATNALALYDHVRHLATTRRGRVSDPETSTPTPIFLHASSFGTAPALCVAARRPVAGAVLQNPPPLRELILGHYGWWNLRLLAAPVADGIPPELDSIANARAASAPAVFLSAGLDWIIPTRYQRQVTDAYHGPKRVIDMPTAQHHSALTREAATDLAEGIQWLWELARASPSELDAAPARTPSAD